MLGRIKQLFSDKKESKASKIMVPVRGQATWSGRDYAAFSREGYQKNVVAYQAVKKIADAVAAIPIIGRALNGDEVADNHPFLQLIQRPNPVQTGQDLLRCHTGFYMLTGNGYMERTMVGRSPRELYTIRPDRMKIYPGTNGMAEAYEYTGPTGGRVKWEADPLTGESDIRHMKTFNPLNDWYGMSPLEAGAFAIDQHNECMASIQALLQNGMSPSGVLEVAGQLSDDQYTRIKAEIEEIYSGSRNKGRPLLLEDSMRWNQMGITPKDAELIQTKYSAARDISLALGVPPLLLNIPGDSTYSNYKEARLAFYEETVIPLAEYILQSLNNWLSPYFGGVKLAHDLDKIPAITEKRRELWEMADRSQDLTINERRDIKGYDPIAGGETLYISSGMIPMSFDLPTQDEE